MTDDPVLSALMHSHPAATGVDESTWRERVEHVAETLDVGPGTTVFDIGCGAGAFLLPLWENHYRVGGLDEDASLLALARQAMPDGQFIVGRPWEVDPAESWQVVASSRGLDPCRSLDEARGLLARMTAKASYAVALLGVRELAGAGGLVADRAQVLRWLAELGVAAVQFETRPDGRFDVFGKV